MAKRRSWARFSLRTLIITTLATSFAFGWIGMMKERGKNRAEAIAAIRSMGGTVRYKLDRATVSGTSASWRQSIEKFARQKLGDEFFDEVKEISLFGKQISDADLRYLKQFPEMEILHLGMNPLNDDSLDLLPQLNELRVLTLQVTHVTDRGLPKLHKFGALERLILPSKPEQISPAAVTRLRKVLPNCDVEQ